MDRAEAEAIYDAGRDACVTFLLELTAGYERQIAGLEERLARLEAQARQDSRTSSKPPSSDPPKTRAQRRAQARARARAKELMRSEGEARKAGGQPGHGGAGRELRPSDQVDEIVNHYPDACGGCGRDFTAGERRPRRRFGRH
jgi:transposase